MRAPRALAQADGDPRADRARRAWSRSPSTASPCSATPGCNPGVAGRRGALRRWATGPLFTGARHHRRLPGGPARPQLLRCAGGSAPGSGARRTARRSSSTLLGLVHALGAGTDASAPWFRWWADRDHAADRRPLRRPGAERRRARRRASGRRRGVAERRVRTARDRLAIPVTDRRGGVMRDARRRRSSAAASPPSAAPRRCAGAATTGRCGSSAPSPSRPTTGRRSPRRSSPGRSPRTSRRLPPGLVVRGKGGRAAARRARRRPRPAPRPAARSTSGDALPYDKLLIATGGAARRLPFLEGRRTSTTCGRSPTPGGCGPSSRRAPAWRSSAPASSARRSRRPRARLGVEVTIDRGARGAAGADSRRAARRAGSPTCMPTRASASLTGAMLEGARGDGRVEELVLGRRPPARLRRGRRRDRDGARRPAGLQGSGLRERRRAHRRRRPHDAARTSSPPATPRSPFDPRFGVHARTEHWDAAAWQGAAAAKAMLGEYPGTPPLPSFWSDQYGLRIQYVGHAHHADDVVIDGDPADRDFEARLHPRRDAGRRPDGRPAARDPGLAARRSSTATSRRATERRQR